MATVGVHGLRGNVQNAIDYILDEEKTVGYLAEGVGVTPRAAAISWNIKNNEKRKPTDLVGYHFRQSFEPGSITPEEAFEIGKKWIESITQGNYDYVIATHVDKKHIHNHIIVNPKNNVTRKDMNIFYKRDLNIFKKLSDDICVEHGKQVLELKGKQFEKTYYEWMLKNKGDSLKEVLRKSMDSVVPMVKDYQEFVNVMESLGFTVEDGSQYEKTEIKEPMLIDITINKKMLHPTIELKDETLFRIPLTREYMKVPKSMITDVVEETTFKVSLLSDKAIEILNEYGEPLRSEKPETLVMHWEDKTQRSYKESGRQGLRVKPPGSSRFIRCNRMEANADGEKYDLESIKKRIEANGRFITSPEVKKILESKDSENLKRSFFDDHGIRVSYKNSQYAATSGYERYVYAKMQSVEKTLRLMRESRSLINDIDNYEGLRIQRNNLVEDLKIVSDTLSKKSNEYERLNYDRMEGHIEASDDEMESYLMEKIVPVREVQSKLRKEIKELDVRLENVRKELNIKREEPRKKKER